MEPVTGNVCQICGKIYQRPGCLESHIRCVHMGEKRSGSFQCSFCPKKLSSNTNRLMHERKMHPEAGSGAAPHASTSRGTPPRPTPPQHARQPPTGQLVHRPGGKTSARKYKCTKCPKGFDLKIGLKMHRQRCHPRSVQVMKREPTVQPNLMQNASEPDAIHVLDSSEEEDYHEDENDVQTPAEPVPSRRHVEEQAVVRPQNGTAVASTSRQGERLANGFAQENVAGGYVEQEILRAKQDLARAKGQLVRANKALVLSRRELVESKKEVLDLKVHLAARGLLPIDEQDPHPRQDLPYRENPGPSHGNRQPNPGRRPAPPRTNETIYNKNLTAARNGRPLQHRKSLPLDKTDVQRSQPRKKSSIPGKGARSTNESTLQATPLHTQVRVPAPERTPATRVPFTLPRSAPTPALRHLPASEQIVPSHQTTPRSSAINHQSTARPPSSEPSHSGASTSFPRINLGLPKSDPTAQPQAPIEHIVIIDEDSEVDKYDISEDLLNSHENQIAPDPETEEHMYVDTYDEAHEETFAVFQPLHSAPEAQPGTSSYVSGNLYHSALYPQPGTSSAGAPDTGVAKQKRYICKCEFCGKRFTTRSTAIVHRRIHTGERPYECSYCDKKYPCKAALTSHTRTHTKPFTCTICGKGFAQKVQLRNHVLKNPDPSHRQ